MGVIGLGAMGAGMAGRVAQAGLLSRAYDIDPARTAPFGEAAANSAAEVFEAGTVVLLSLPGAAQVESVLTAMPAHGGRNGTAAITVVDTTTRSPQQARDLARLVTAAGHHYLDAPVSGGALAAEQGTLRVMIGGDDTALAGARQALEAISGGNHVHVGPVGAGSACKLMNNILYAANLVTVGEAIYVAQAHGVAPTAFLDALNGASGRSVASELVYPRFVLSGGYDSRFAIGLIRRDVELAISSLPAGCRAPVLELLRTVWAQSAAFIADGDDTTHIFEALPAIADAHGPEAHR
ncbi:NAD(P)-dependent oxidoreductase [Actinomadura sp. 6K520]|nr:NAD(P)-dependent oxidoreductase [Actinomadura sp. 6K520]TDE19061.1 NAD(P)-dependent oxidoreductase [Actinomadura sp. 6K520]